MNATMYTLIIIVVCVGITGFLVWKLNKFRTTKAYKNNDSRLIKFLKWEEKFILKFTKPTNNKIGAQIQALIKKVSDRIKIKTKSRFWLLLIALALIIGGQIIMHRTIHIDSWTDIRQSINDWLRVDAKFLGNVLIGMSCSILGGVLFAITSYKTELFKTNLSAIFPVPDSPILKKFHVSKWLLPFLLGSIFFAILMIRVWIFELEFFDVFFWIAAIFFITSAVFKYDKASGISILPNQPYRDVGIIILLLIMGLLIGTYQLQNIPNSIQGDEGVFFENARAIANGNYTHSIFGFGVYSYPIFSSFIQGAVMRIFGKDIWGWRFASVLPALLSVVPLYFLGKEVFNRRVGIISSLIYISSPYYLSFARLGYNNSQAILFVTLCVWLFYLGLKRKSLLYIFLTGVAAGLGFLTYSSGKLGMVIITLLFAIFFLLKLFRKGTRRFILIGFLMFVIGYTLIAVPHLSYGITQDPQTFRYKLVEGLFNNFDYAVSMFGEQSVTQTSTITYLDRFRIIHSPELSPRLLLRGVVRSLLGLQFDEFSNNYYLSASLAGPIAVVFYVCGLFAVLAHFWKPNSYPFLIWFISGLFFLSIISTYPPRPAHLVPIIPILALFSGLGVYVVVEQITKHLDAAKRSWAPLQPVLLTACCLLIMIFGIREYYVESPKMYRPNLEQVMNWAGLQNPRETEIYYIYDSEYYKDWVPYYYRLELTKPSFNRLHIEQIRDCSVQWPEDKDFSLFFEENTAAELIPVFKEQFDSAKFITIRDRDNKPVGRAVVNGSVKLSTEVTFWVGLGNLLTSRVMWLVWPLIAFVIYLAIKKEPIWGTQKLRPEFVSKFKNFKAGPILSIFNTSSSKTPSANSLSEPERSFELGFFFRLGLRQTDREYQAKIVLNSSKKQNQNQEQNNPLE